MCCGFTYDKFHAEITHIYTYAYMLLLQETGAPLKARSLLCYSVLLVCQTMKGRNSVPVVTCEHTIGKRNAWGKYRTCIQLLTQNIRKQFLLTFINALRRTKKKKTTLMMIVFRHTELVKADVGGKQQYVYLSWMRIKTNRWFTNW